MLHGEKPRPPGASDRVTRLLRCTSSELGRFSDAGLQVMGAGAVLGGRRSKTSKGRNRELEGRPRRAIYGDLANGVGSGGASGMAN